MEFTQGNYKISDDPSLLNIERIVELLSKTYWASQRPVEVTQKAINNSICYGIYEHDRQIGFARVVTDDATMYYIADVVVDETHRGHGLGKKLIQSITGEEAYRNLRGMLLTSDAHGLYEKYGFSIETEKFMMKPPE